MSKLGLSFYQRPVLDVAPDLLGKILVHKNGNQTLSGRIVEVEAYSGSDDPASHAYRGKTLRNAVMFGPGGFSYVYFIYGMYHCFNIVCSVVGEPSACLIRAIVPLEGIELMKRRRKSEKLADGPGKLCQAMGITRRQSEISLNGSQIFLMDDGTKLKFTLSPRIGIRFGKDKLWRFSSIPAP